ncbi:MAG: ABC transporter ATP-binding protein [Acholeplasmataceae bacterium]|nr:ABC transporter ATP-binding protein [Acholeplasmataceae bacterium]
MKRMFKYLKPHWVSVLVILFLVAISAMGQLLLPDFMSKMIGEGIKPIYEVYDPTSEAFVSTDFCDINASPDTCRIIGQESDMDIILHYGGWMAIVTLASTGAAILLMYLSSKVSSLTGKSIRADIFRKVNQFSMADTDQFGTSSLITRSTNDVVQIQNFLIMFLRMVVRIPIIFTGALILSWNKSKELTQVLFGGVPVLAILVIVVFILALPLFRVMQKKIDKITLVTREGINGVRVIRAFDKGDKEVNRFQEANNDLTKTMVKTGNILAFMNPAVNLVFSIVILAVIFFAYRLILGSQSSDYQALANVSAVMQYSFQIMFSLLMLTFTFIMYPRAEVSGKRVSEVLETDIKIKDSGDPQYDTQDFRGEIEFSDVCFKYDDAEKNVLEHISFSASPGEVVALIGSTGSGKSTTINLLPRFFDVTCGEIKIDGVDIRQLSLKKLRSLIGFVPQKATLFSGTIRENITYGNPDATEEEIEKAVRIGQADDFIEAIDQRYEAVVEQGAVNFSGGQKQRLSIVRALVRRSPIYVFDDSFSALDFKTDAALRLALRSEIKDATVLIVAQRIGTIMDADKIIVFHEGRIVGIGTHRELIQNCDVYREIALSQLSEEELV